MGRLHGQRFIACPLKGIGVWRRADRCLHCFRLRTLGPLLRTLTGSIDRYLPLPLTIRRRHSTTLPSIVLSDKNSLFSSVHLLHFCSLYPSSHCLMLHQWTLCSCGLNAFFRVATSDSEKLVAVGRGLSFQRSIVWRTHSPSVHIGNIIPYISYNISDERPTYSLPTCPSTGPLIQPYSLYPCLPKPNTSFFGLYLWPVYMYGGLMGLSTYKCMFDGASRHGAGRMIYRARAVRTNVTHVRTIRPGLTVLPCGQIHGQ